MPADARGGLPERHRGHQSLTMIRLRLGDEQPRQVRAGEIRHGGAAGHFAELVVIVLRHKSMRLVLLDHDLRRHAALHAHGEHGESRQEQGEPVE